MLNISERRACRALRQHRSTQRKASRGKEDEGQLTADPIELARQYGRYGHRKITASLRDAGWLVNDKRVERIWRREGLNAGARRSAVTQFGARTFAHSTVILASAQRSKSSLWRRRARNEQNTWPRMAASEEWKIGRVSKLAFGALRYRELVSRPSSAEPPEAG